MMFGDQLATKVGAPKRVIRAWSPKLFMTRKETETIKGYQSAFRTGAKQSTFLIILQCEDRCYLLCICRRKRKDDQQQKFTLFSPQPVATNLQRYFLSAKKATNMRLCR